MIKVVLYFVLLLLLPRVQVYLPLFNNVDIVVHFLINQSGVLSVIGVQSDGSRSLLGSVESCPYSTSGCRCSSVLLSRAQSMQPPLRATANTFKIAMLSVYYIDKKRKKARKKKRDTHSFYKQTMKRTITQVQTLLSYLLCSQKGRKKHKSIKSHECSWDFSSKHAVCVLWWLIKLLMLAKRRSLTSLAVLVI